MEELIKSLILEGQIVPYLGVAGALLLTGVGFPCPEDIILLFAGFLVSEGQANLYIMIGVALFAILASDLLIYTIGYHFGQNVIKVRPFRWIFTTRLMERVNKFYARYGKATIFVGRFGAGLRAWIYLLAGTSKMKVFHFVLMDFLAALISVPLLVWLGFYLPDQIARAFATKTKLVIMIIIGLLVLTYLIYRLWSRPVKPIPPPSFSNPVGGGQESCGIGAGDKE
jgi:membrane protein DedA with SNARE-associated domain